MKNFLLTLLLIPIFGLNAQQVWYADPSESGILKVFGNINKNVCETGSVPNPQTVTISDLNTKIWRVFSATNVLRNEFSRTEGQIQNFVHKQGEDYYYAWRVRVNIKIGRDSKDEEMAIFQWKTSQFLSSNVPDSDDLGEGSQNHPLNISYSSSGKFRVNYFAPCKSGNSFNNWRSCSGFPRDRRTTLYEQNLANDEWIEIVLRIQRGTTEQGAESGKVSLWINGSQKTLLNPYNLSERKNTIDCKTDDAFNNNYDDRSVYPKWGIYGGNSCGRDLDSDIHDLMIFTNAQDAINNLISSRPSNSSLSNDDFITDNTKKQINIYPNPVKESFRIKLQNIKKAEVTITNILGKIIYKTNIENSNSILIDRYKLTSGFYIVRVKDEVNQTFTSKLVIE